MTVASRVIAWGPVGQEVYSRSYSRDKKNGQKETWPETVARAVDGNLSLVDPKHIEPGERDKLIEMITNFKMLPAGRHLSMSGVPGRQFLFNCHVAGWDYDDIALHSEFTFDQLMQGGGVGSNYSNRYIDKYPRVQHKVDLHIVCSPDHPDYEEMKPYLSEEYSWSWPGSLTTEDSREGWYGNLRLVIERAFALIDKGPLVLDMSVIRAKYKPIKTFGGVAAGPMPLAATLIKVASVLNARVGQKLTSLDWMLMDHYTAEAVIAGGIRRSSRMALKSWKDDDIFDFIDCKMRDGQHWSTNVSIEIDDEFLRELRSYTNGHGPNRAQKIYMLGIERALTNGEPGWWNRSLCQVGEVEDIFSCNPCGEISMLPWENCNLGHVNLQAFAEYYKGGLIRADNSRSRAIFHQDECIEAHRLMARFLIRATFGDVPNEKQREVMQRMRRIGVGHLGFAGWLAKLNWRFSESHHNVYVRRNLVRFKKAVEEEAAAYASQLRIPVPIKTTTLAPTGTVAKLPGATESAEPVKFRYFVNRIRYSTNQKDQLDELSAQGYHIEPDLNVENTMVVSFPCKSPLIEEMEALGYTAEEIDSVVEEQSEISLADRLAVQQMYQDCYVDNSISNTITVMPDERQQEWITQNPSLVEQGQMCTPLPSTVAEAASIIKQFLPHIKGVTLMVEASRRQMPQERMTREQYEATRLGAVGDLDSDDCSRGSCPIGAVNEPHLIGVE